MSSFPQLLHVWWQIVNLQLRLTGLTASFFHIIRCIALIMLMQLACCTVLSVATCCNSMSHPQNCPVQDFAMAPKIEAIMRITIHQSIQYSWNWDEIWDQIWCQWPNIWVIKYTRSPAWKSWLRTFLVGLMSIKLGYIKSALCLLLWQSI